MANHATDSGSKAVEIWTPFSVEYFAENMVKGHCTDKHHNGCQNPDSWKSLTRGLPAPTPSCAYGKHDTPVGQIGAERIDNHKRCRRIRVIVQEVEPGEYREMAPGPTPAVQDDEVFGIPTEGGS